jgi:Flp pilus assembly CpaE family ATPase
MSSESRSIILISNEPHLSSEVGAALRAMPKVHLEEHSATLSELNGSAVQLAAQHDVVVFRTDPTSDHDIQAIGALRKELSARSVVLALSDASISLGDARRLTQAGVNEVLPYPLSMDELRRQIEHWTTPTPVPNLPAHYTGALRQGKVLAVAQARGGIGATTVAINLADGLVDRHGTFKKQPRNKVVLVDLDIQFGTVATSLDIDPSDALFQMAIDGEMPDALFLQQAIVKHSSGLSVLSAPARFSPLEALRGEQIGRLLDLLRREYDYVVVDLPRSLVDWVGAVIERTDLLFVVTDCAVASVRQTRRLIDFYTEEHLSLPIEVVMCRERKPIVYNRHVAEASKVLERSFKYWIPDDPRPARDALDRGVPLSVAAGRSQIAKAIGAMARGTLKTLKAPTTQQSPSK